MEGRPERLADYFLVVGLGQNVSRWVYLSLQGFGPAGVRVLFRFRFSLSLSGCTRR